MALINLTPSLPASRCGNRSRVASRGKANVSDFQIKEGKAILTVAYERQSHLEFGCFLGKVHEFFHPSSIFSFKKIIVKFFNIVALGGNLLNRTKLADFWTV